MTYYRIRPHAGSVSILSIGVNHTAGDPLYAPLMETTAGMGQRMRELRNSRNMNLAEVGKILGISGQAVGQVENGVTKNLKLPHFLRFCAYFDADPYYVVFGKPKPKSGGRPRLLDLG